jgi:putative spermidine/putrescine transport system substrate-binding protein
MPEWFLKRNGRERLEENMTNWKFSRRTALKGAGAVALTGFATQPARANGRVVVGTWGGDYARLLAKNIEDPLLKPKGFEVAQDQANSPPRRTKMLAEKRLPRGTSDIQGLSAAERFEMNEGGVAETIDYSKLKNAANLIPSMKYPYGVGHIYSGKVVVYNPKLIPEAPKSFKDAFDPRHGNKMGIIDIQYQYTMAAASMAAGGKLSDFDPGKAILMEAKKAGVRVYPTNEAFAQALKNEEIGIGIMWKARVIQWQNAGISVQSVAPSEGVPMYVSGFVIPKNAPNKDGAYAYMDAMLEKSAQENFAIDMGYNPTVTNAVVAPDLKARIGFTKEEESLLVDLDYAYLAKNDAALKEWWDKVFKA